MSKTNTYSVPIKDIWPGGSGRDDHGAPEPLNAYCCARPGSRFGARRRTYQDSLESSVTQLAQSSSVAMHGPSNAFEGVDEGPQLI
jgi:hypothetical protein